MAVSMTVKKAAAVLGVSQHTLYRWHRDGTALPAGWTWDLADGRQARLVPPEGVLPAKETTP